MKVNMKGWCDECKKFTEHYLDVHPTKNELKLYCCRCQDRRKQDLGREEGERRKDPDNV